MVIAVEYIRTTHVCVLFSACSLFRHRLHRKVQMFGLETASMICVFPKTN